MSGYAEGRLRTREWEGNDGQKRTSVEIRADRVVSLERREPSEGSYGDANRGGGSADEPVVRPRGTARPSEETIDVDDIPF